MRAIFIRPPAAQHSGTAIIIGLLPSRIQAQVAWRTFAPAPLLFSRRRTWNRVPPRAKPFLSAPAMEDQGRAATNMKEPLPEFEFVLSRTRRAQVAEVLRNAIFAGKIAPGTQLVEMKLAHRLGVSRGSVREAILELVEQGLVVNKPYAGTFVIRIDEKSLGELFSLRKVLDRYAFTMLWPRRDDTYRTEFTARNRAIARAMETGQRTAAIKA